MNTIRLGGIQYLNLIPDFKKIRAEQRAETYDHPGPAPSKTRDHLLSGSGLGWLLTTPTALRIPKLSAACLTSLSCYKLQFK